MGRESGIKRKLFLEWDREIVKSWEVEGGKHPLKIGEKKYFNEQGSGRSWAGRVGLKFENGFKKEQGLFL